MSAGTPVEPLAPGAVVGILGGGQLGRMTALAAARLGYPCHVYCGDGDDPAAQVAAATTVAAYDDGDALAQFAAAVDVATIEFENVPVAAVEQLGADVPTRPDARALAVAQDRVAEKDFVADAGIATTRYAAVADAAGLAAALVRVGTPAIVKTRRFGYDGKGQVRVDDAGDAAAAWCALGDVAAGAIVERVVAFEHEISVIVARGGNGAMAAYDVVENRHRDHILAETIAPAPLDEQTAAQAREIGERLADGLALTGLLAVELFVADDGDLLVNEIAPRPHNSGHWTIDACATSQFEQLVRAICGLPLGSTARHADAVMHNLLGDDVASWPEYAADPRAHLHLYGKRDARPGRKMGHVTWLKERR